jgi:hypothetical protein
MSSPLPCFQSPPTCHFFDYLHKCATHRELQEGGSTEEWVVEKNKCPELNARAEGWEVPCE